LKKNKLKPQQGFSLLEILIAFTIMAFSLSIMLNIFSGGINTAAIAEDYTIAVEIAESLMAKTGSEIPLSEHQSTGEEDQKYRWSLSIVPYSLSADLIEPDNAQVQAKLFKIDASVMWGDGESDDREIRLTTLKLAGKNRVRP
jgi:general secretion pathway protein I